MQYNGLGKFMESLEISSREELVEAVLNPSAYQEIWRRSYERAGGHDWHELTFFHDTLCFIQESDGRRSRQDLVLLGDYLQNPADYLETCVIKALEELGLVTSHDNVIQLTKRASGLKYSPRFLPVPYAEDQ